MPRETTSLRGVVLGLLVGAAVVIAYMLGHSTSNQPSTSIDSPNGEKPAAAGSTATPGSATFSEGAQGRPLSTARRIKFNGQALDGAAFERLQGFEQQIHQRFPDNDYWYDNRSGAAGVWGGPTAAFIPPGLELGPPVPANASTGGTGVFVNGRELHPLDVDGLRQIMAVLPGRYWVDGQGIGGYEGEPPLFNIVQLASQARQRGASGGGPWGQNMAGGANGAYTSGDGDRSVMGRDPSGNVFMVGP